MSSDGPYGRQGFNANSSGDSYGGAGGASYAQPQYGYGGGQTYGAGTEYNTYGAQMPEYQVREERTIDEETNWCNIMGQLFAASQV